MAFGATSELKIILSLRDKASAKLESFDKRFGKMANKIAKGALLAGGAMAVGIGVKAVKSAVDFEKAMANVATLVDTTTENMSKMGREVREISKRVPVDIADLTTALYQVRSAGISASDAMAVLESSAKLAVAGLGTTEEATNLLTSAVNVFAKQGYSASEMADILFKTVKAGKTTVAELAQSFGMVAPIAGELNIDFRELQAATAALTTTGLKASVAQSQLRAGMVALLKPTGDMDKLYEKIGITSGRELLETSGGLVEAFDKIKVAAEGDDTALAKAFGSVEALNAVLALTGDEIGLKFTETLEGMTGGTNALNDAVEKQKETAEAQYQIFKNTINDLLIPLGNRILPVLIDVMKKLTDMIDTAQWLWGVWSGKISTGNTALADLETKLLTVKFTAEESWKKLKKVADVMNTIGGWITGVTPAKGLTRVSGWLKEKIGLQEGGIVTSPTRALIGEKGPEAVIPLGRGLAGAGIGGITVNILGGTYLSEEVAEDIGNKIIEKLKFQLKF